MPREDHLVQQIQHHCGTDSHFPKVQLMITRQMTFCSLGFARKAGTSMTQHGQPKTIPALIYQYQEHRDGCRGSSPSMACI